MNKLMVGTAQNPTRQVNRAEDQTALKTAPSSRAWLPLAF